MSSSLILYSHLADKPSGVAITGSDGVVNAGESVALVFFCGHCLCVKVCPETEANYRPRFLRILLFVNE